MDYSFLPIKFFKEEIHLKQFLSGLLYCNTFKHFRESENDNNTRCDPNEGIKSKENIKSGIVKLKPSDDPNAVWKKLSFDNLSVTQYHGGNIFCFSRFILYPTEEVSIFEISNKFNEFGDYYALITDENLFVDRIKSAFNNLPYKARGEMVKYENLTNHIEERSPFIKDEMFAWQNEYRLHIETNLTEPLRIEIGDISDIAITGRLSIKRAFNFKTPAKISN